MIQPQVLTIFLVSVSLLVGISFSNNATFEALSAVTPQGAREVIEQSKSPQEAGEKLKALDSSELVRNHQTLDTTKDVFHGEDASSSAPSDRRDEEIKKTGQKLKDLVEAAKEKVD